MSYIAFRLILIRHAHAQKSKEWHGHDLDRPLTIKGKKVAKRVGQNLALALTRDKEVLEACYASEALRSSMTAAYILKSFPKISCMSTAIINPQTGVQGYLDLIKESLEEGNLVVAIVGHENDLLETVFYLCGRCRIDWKKGGYLILHLINDEWYLDVRGV